MADIITNTLQIGSNNLILRDADAQEQLVTVKDGLTAVETQLEQTTADMLNAYVTDTASGAIASFPDGADGVPVKSLTVNIEPVQDLNGYDNPWPAGGGKNLLPNKTGQVGPAQLILGDDATAMASATGIYLTSGTYTITVNSSKTSSIYIYAVSDGSNWNPGNTLASRVITIESDGYYVPFLYNSAGISESDITSFQLESGSTATSYAPYSNICPISGHTQAVVMRTGVNVWDEESETGGYDASTGEKVDGDKIRSKNKIPCLPNTTYFFACTGSYNGWVGIYFYDANENYVSVVAPNVNHTFSTPANARFLTFNTSDGYSKTYNHDISINYPSTDHDYHSGQVAQYTIDLNGTVYGGTLDVLTGVLTVDSAFIASYNGETLPSTWISDRDVYAAGTTPTTGAQVCYKLATPQTVQLTANEIKTILGHNNIWNDCGDTTVEYRADTKLYINKVLNA